MDVYRELGVEPIINAAGTLTVLGGSLMPPEVTDAMAAASRAFVNMRELHEAAGRRIAELIGAEAAHVTSGAAAGITLMAAACMAGSDPKRIAQLPDTTGMRSLFVVQRSHRNPYDQALRVAGGRFLDIDANAAQLQEAAAREEVAGVFYTVAWFCRGESLALPQVVEIAHRHGKPVLVDAAAEVPPVENLRRFLAEGADLVAFSGGKAIRGPQCTGLLLGRRDLIEACALNDNPNYGVGRPMKVGKEEIIGLVKAVELYVRKDHAVEMAVWERRVAHILSALSDLPHVRVWRQFPYGIGQLIPHAALTWDVEAVGITPQELVDKLLAGKPRIAVQLVNPARHSSDRAVPEIRVHPHTLCDGEEMVVARRLRELLGGSGHPS